MIKRPRIRGVGGAPLSQILSILLIGAAMFLVGFYVARRTTAPPLALPVAKPPSMNLFGVIPTRNTQGHASDPLEKPPLMILNPQLGTSSNSNPILVARNNGQSPMSVGDSDRASDLCAEQSHAKATSYYAHAQRGEAYRLQRGTLTVAAFSRLWVPPIHGTGGMQFHALHLYSQLAARGHMVHVFVTGPPHGTLKTIYYKINPLTLHAEQTHHGDTDAKLIVEQVASDQNSEYSESWYENCLARFQALNRTVNGGKGFHVVHSESWAAVPNAYQLGLQMLVTWHGSMFDWFRNEVNLIVHNYRMKSKMPSTSTASRMGALGSSVAYEAYMLLSVSHHVVISDSAADDLVALNLISPQRVHLIYNGVNPKNFQPAGGAELRRREFFQAHHLTDIPVTSFVVGCGGRLDGIKGHHQLSVAMRQVLTEHSDVVLLVAGSGGEGKRYEAMKADNLRVYLLGMLDQVALATFYQVLDVFVDPFYQHHGLNTVMLEAALSAVPVVATSLASAKTTAPCDAFGRVFPLGDVKGLAAQVVYFKDHPEERKRVGQQARERAVQLFDSSVMAGSYEALLYEVVENPLPLEPLTGKVVCRHTYPAMCYREPHSG